MILVVVGVIVGTVVLSVIRKKKGKTACGCDCASCSSCPHCNAKDSKES
ncbi:MAG: FeoB-associated Cys-rich membrane protein [Clostridia bacterium]|nr:FeoB-associated Cys-rich membrane protein [Clostridia bacterium]